MSDDLASLDSIDTPAVLAALQSRFDDKKIYTKNGTVLLAINPYFPVDMYGDERVMQYKQSMAIDKEPPHIFAVAAASHRNMISSGKNQAIVISGESGAGKTESARFVLQYLRFVSNATTELENRIHGSQPITEAFGCAKTLRNDNSSRFGKFLMLNFNSSAKIQGASLDTYLLEKSRITSVGTGERSYHIFYCMLKGLGSKTAELKLEAKPASYLYLSAGEVGEASDRMNDGKMFNEVVEALEQQGVSKEQMVLYWQCLAGVQHLGNVQFDDKADNATPKAGAAQALANCEHVLGLQSGMLAKALTKRKIKAGNEFVEQDMSTVQAIDGRDALSKAIYSRLFDKLIAQINSALSMGQESVLAPDGSERIIGVVDIFGFEVFGVNSLEQLCINFANEKLQALFTKSVFKETIAAYAADGIQADDITFKDNSDLIEMFEMPKTGMWAILNEECVIPKGTDDGFTEKLHDANRKSTVISTVKGKSAKEGFSVAHFAGAVTYSTKNWLTKNKDPLNGDLMVLMQFSDNAVLKALFSAESAPAAPGGKFKSNKFKGIIDGFNTGLGKLVSVLDESALHFVRCFKPNDAKKAHDWQNDVITRQLHTSGVLDALRVARTGYPDRMPFEEFNGTYAFVGGVPKGEGKQACSDLCNKLGLKPNQYKLGRERIFLALGVLGELKAMRQKAMAGVAKVLQSAARGLNARAKVRVMREDRGEKAGEMMDACQGDDIDTLKKAIAAAKAIGIGKSKYDEKGKAAVAEATDRLKELEKIQAERKAAADALTRLADAAMPAAGKAQDMETGIATVRKAIEDAKSKGVAAAVVSAGESKLKKLMDEQQRRADEEKRQAEEEARLKAQKDKKKREAEEKRLAEERKKREEEAAKKAAADKVQEEKEKAEAAAKAAKAAEMEAQKGEMDAKAKAEAEMREAEEAEQRALEEEEALRQKVLGELQKSGTVFRSAPEDVLEYAVYLGMQLDEDKELLWIADQALQAEDPEGWSQCESPNGDLYYVNQVTMQVLWQHPLDYQYQQTYLEEKKKLMEKGGGKPAASKAAPTESPAAPASRASGGDDKGGDVKVSDDQLRSLLHSVLGSRHADLRSLLLEPACSQKLVRCYVVRHKSRMGGGHRFDFFMSLSPTNDMYCFTGKKQSVAKGCYYSISLDQEESKRSKAATADSFIGKVRSDRKSMEYTLYDDGAAPETKEKGQLRRELLYVNFINSLRNRNPGAMEVVVPRVDMEGKPVLVRPAMNATDGLAERHKNPAKASDLVSLKNREPKWNPASNMYQLDFQGRATMASCKNIQLHAKDGPDNDICFLMGKVDDNKFNIDFKHPMSCLQAFAFALIVFDNSSGI